MYVRSQRVLVAGLILYLVLGCQSQSVSSTLITQTVTGTITPTRVNVPERKLTVDTLPALIIGGSWKNITEQARQQGYVIMSDKEDKKAILVGEKGSVDAGIGITIKGDDVVSLGFAVRLAGQDVLSTGMPPKYWDVVNPQTLLQQYGSPTMMRATVVYTGMGPIAGVTLFWENLNIASTYTILTEGEITTRNRIVRFCVSPKATIEAQSWITSDNVKETVFKEKQDIGKYGSEFKVGMFTNARTLDDVRNVILRGECLQSSLAFWGY